MFAPDFTAVRIECYSCQYSARVLTIGNDCMDLHDEYVDQIRGVGQHVADRFITQCRAAARRIEMDVLGRAVGVGFTCKCDKVNTGIVAAADEARWYASVMPGMRRGPPPRLTYPVRLHCVNLARTLSKHNLLTNGASYKLNSAIDR